MKRLSQKLYLLFSIGQSKWESLKVFRKKNRSNNPIVVDQVNTVRKIIALTFDDLYNLDNGHFDSIINTLECHQIKCTFFPTGHAIFNDPHRMNTLVDAGHEIGNHSWAHRNLTKHSLSKIFQEIKIFDLYAKNILNQAVKPYFRPPRGYLNQDVLEAAGTAGYSHTIKWSVNTHDASGQSAEEIHNIVVSQVQPGAIVLLHINDGAINTPIALPRIISDLKNEGYDFVTLSQLMEYHQSE